MSLRCTDEEVADFLTMRRWAERDAAVEALPTFSEEELEERAKARDEAAWLAREQGPWGEAWVVAGPPEAGKGFWLVVAEDR